jgi:hypothetical protein
MHRFNYDAGWHAPGARGGDEAAHERLGPAVILLILTLVVWMYSPEHARKELDAISV